MLLSAFCHLTAFIVLGLLSVISHDGWRGVKLLVNVGDGFDSPSIDDSELDDAVTLEVAADDAAAAVDPTRLFDVSTMAATDFAALEALSENAAEASGLDGIALGGKGEADGSLTGASAEFFGIGGYGQTFVYVVDCSGSMSERGKVREGDLRAAAFHRTAGQRPAIFRDFLQRRGVSHGCRRAGAGERR